MCFSNGNGEEYYLIDLHLSECIVDLGGGELDTEGHEGVSERINMRMIAVMVIMMIMMRIIVILVRELT